VNALADWPEVAGIGLKYRLAGLLKNARLSAFGRGPLVLPNGRNAKEFKEISQ